MPSILGRWKADVFRIHLETPLIDTNEHKWGCSICYSHSYCSLEIQKLVSGKKRLKNNHNLGFEASVIDVGKRSESQRVPRWPRAQTTTGLGSDAWAPHSQQAIIYLLTCGSTITCAWIVRQVGIRANNVFYSNDEIVWLHPSDNLQSIHIIPLPHLLPQKSIPLVHMGVSLVIIHV